jgi:hypothetical protein
MKNATGYMVVALGVCAGSMTARARQTQPLAKPASAPAIASVMEAQLKEVKHVATARLVLEAATERDGQRDFDFELGSWKTHIRRLLRPLTGSDSWVELDGISTVRKVWDGRANLGELEVSNATTHLEGLSLRVYSPESRQWSIYWANSSDGRLGPAMTGQFRNGRGEFYDQELFQGSAIYVRFVFSDLTPRSFRLEQSFSSDGGKTWEPNWIATFARQAE